MFDGIDNYVEVGGSLLFSVATTGALTVSVWMMPEVLTFIHSVKGYVHWLGKGTGFGNSGQQEWTFRMYDFANDANRPNRISFYVFNPEGRLGVGSYYQDPNDPVVAGQWMQQCFWSEIHARYFNSLFPLPPGSAHRRRNRTAQ